MLLDDYIEENRKLMNIDIDVKKKDIKREVTPKEYMSAIDLDSVGVATKKAVKTDFGYTIALATAGGIGLSIYFHSFSPLVYMLVGGVVTNTVLSVAQRAKAIEFK